MSNEELRSDIAYCTYELNGEPISQIFCDGVGYDAFSGNSATYANDVRYQDVPDNGPIPLGKYYILDREGGGKLGWARQPIQDYFAGTDRSQWLSLYRDDGQLDDNTMINNVPRGAFRIHPVGPLGISEGCVTLISPMAFDELRTTLRNRTGDHIIINGNLVKYYGILEVYKNRGWNSD